MNSLVVNNNSHDSVLNGIEYYRVMRDGKKDRKQLVKCKGLNEKALNAIATIFLFIEFTIKMDCKLTFNIEGASQNYHFVWNPSTLTGVRVLKKSASKAPVLVETKANVPYILGVARIKNVEMEEGISKFIISSQVNETIKKEFEFSVIAIGHNLNRAIRSKQKAVWIPYDVAVKNNNFSLAADNSQNLIGNGDIGSIALMPRDETIEIINNNNGNCSNDSVFDRAEYLKISRKTECSLLGCKGLNPNAVNGIAVNILLIKFRINSDCKLIFNIEGEPDKYYLLPSTNCFFKRSSILRKAVSERPFVTEAMANTDYIIGIALKYYERSKLIISKFSIHSMRQETTKKEFECEIAKMGEGFLRPGSKTKIFWVPYDTSFNNNNNNGNSISEELGNNNQILSDSDDRELESPDRIDESEDERSTISDISDDERLTISDISDVEEPDEQMQIDTASETDE
ncbi:MAG: hypothetical protein Q8K75_07080 [Chlamydiales bacterium]|nr:hypothetical protein [Chlamydiales bacterium]